MQNILIQTIIIFIVILLLSLLLIFNNNSVQTEPNPYIVIIKNPQQIPTQINLRDPIKDYDIRKAFDPFEQPARRIPSDELYSYNILNMIDIPTRGYADNFTQIGILIIDDNNNNKSQDENKNIINLSNMDNTNRVLRLFGRQIYTGSDKYEYYYMMNSGLDRIKIPLNVRRRELYSDDLVYIPELEHKYRVRLFDFDQPKYYPFV